MICSSGKSFLWEKRLLLQVKFSTGLTIHCFQRVKNKRNKYNEASEMIAPFFFVPNGVRAEALI